MVNLGKEVKKGQKISLTKKSDAVQNAGTNLQVGLKWNSNTDVDASIVCLGTDGKRKDFIYFGNKRSQDGAIVHLGDDTTGHSIQGLSGDNETITVDLNKINPAIDSIVFITNIYDGPSKRQTFANIGQVTLRVINKDTKDVITFYGLDGKANVNAAIVGKMYRRGTDWNFEAIGEELFLNSGRLSELISRYN